MKRKVLLINPSSARAIYAKSKIRAGIAEIPLLSLAIIAAPLLKRGHEVKILDLSISRNPYNELVNVLNLFKPDFAGITFTSPLFKEAIEISRIIKEQDKNIKVVAGGVHSTLMPEEVAREKNFDIVVVGEGEIILSELVDYYDRVETIKGIAFIRDEQFVFTGARPHITDIDELPLPSWHLYDLTRYKTPRLSSRKNPVGPFESSRGCPNQCTYCNKGMFGNRLRLKSVNRVVDEMEYMLECGFREIHIWEDNFSANLKRAKEICREIIRRRLRFPWNIFAGLRVDRVDKELFELLKEAGCYGVGLAAESGNQELLDRIKKRITLDQIRKAFRFAKEAELETTGFFMFGLPGETEETMKNTIDFAIELNPTYAKVTILVPFPKTAIFEEWDKLGIIKTKDWAKYNFHSANVIYDHPNLDWDILKKYYDFFYRKFYFRPSYVTTRIKNGLLNGNILYDFYYFLKTWIR